MSSSLRFPSIQRPRPPFYGGRIVTTLTSLRFRLLFMLAIVVIVAVGSAALVGSWTITTQFQRFVQQGGTLSVRCFDVVVGSGTRIGEDVFIGSVNRSLLLAVLAAGAVAVVLTVTFSRRILGPISQLTAAARKMEKGDLQQRVKVQSHDELGTLAHAFNAMADGLAHMEQLRRHLVSDVAHELRTPLSNIRGYVEAMQDGVVDPSPALLASLHEEAMLLSRLVDDLQDLALAEAGQLDLMCQPASAAEIIGKTVNSLRTATTAKQLAVALDVPDDLPAVRVDRERIGQVLRNLLNNAITHTPPGGAITVTARAAGSYVEISVQDTGSGIGYQHLPYVFERFYRADRSRTRATGGAGLGLAIVKQLVEAHGGRVWVRSTVGVGTTFLFTVPVTLSTLATAP